MPQLDRFLSVLVSNRAESLQLQENASVTVRKDGADRAVTSQPLTAQQLLMLVREIAPPDAVQQLSTGTSATFRYTTPDGVFVAKVSQTDGRWQATIAADAPASGGAQPTPATASPAAAAAPRGNGAISVLAERREGARAEMDTLLRLMVEKSASDLHLRTGEPPILRTHGEMMRLEGRPVLEADHLEMMLASIMPERNKKEFAEANDTDYAYEIEGVARFRANALRDRKGPAAVFRVIPATVVSVEQMGISQEVQNLCYLTKGLVLVTGPTGSGKSTTLCSLIDLVNRSRTDHVITIEDPIEFVHPNKKCIITQRQVGVHTTSFKSALRAALREDPDIILVGELRDLETVSIAIETAETGHLVFGTLHTTTAAGTIDRIIDQFPADRQEQIRVMLAESLKGVISQTLCKKIGGGRVAAREILLSIPAVSNLVREGKTFQIPSVMQTSKRLGMITLNDALIDLVDNKLVEPKEAYMKAVEKQTFATALKSRGHDVSFLESDGGGPGGPAAGGAPAAPSGNGAGAAKPGAAAGRPVAGAGGARR
ncbi:MAG TPA: type IV pilus twitching motility protein PilT [Gemmatimonadaceae bacterium]|nr:type IV pilus twitching motility protein PilT [Gemmatimonadaceae bacterium]